MTTAERIHLLRRHGLENAVVAAVLGVDASEIAAHVLDPSHEVTVGGGGSGDVTGLLPLDGSRSATLVDFAGAVGDEQGGGTLAWDDDLYGLVFKGRSGSGDAEVYLVNPDDAGNYANAYPGGLSLHDASNYAQVANNYLGVHTDAWLFSVSGGMLQMEDASGPALGYAVLVATPQIGFNSYKPTLGLIAQAPVGAPSTALLSFGEAQHWNSFLIDQHGLMEWGDGASMTPDVTLERADPDTYANGMLHFSGGLVGGYPTWDDPGWWIDSYGLFFDDGNGGTGKIDRGVVKVAQAGAASELQLNSPDGTLYKLTPPNGGGPATWVAA